MDEGIKIQSSSDGTREKSCSVQFPLRLHDTFDCIMYLLAVLVVGWGNPFHHDARRSKAMLCKRQGLHFQRVHIHTYIHIAYHLLEYKPML
jgi:hypothetical protein